MTRPDPAKTVITIKLRAENGRLYRYGSFADSPMNEWLMTWIERGLHELARAAAAEGKRLARKVRRGELTRADIEQDRREYPGDIELVIALEWLDKWGIRS